jgi:hypothetical protein
VRVADLLLHVVLHLRMHGHTGRARRTAQRCRQTLIVADVLERLSHDTCSGNTGSRRHQTHHGTAHDTGGSNSSSSRTGDTTAVASLGFFEGDVDFSPPDASVTATTTMGGAPGAAVAVVVAAAVVAVGPEAISLALDSDADVVVVVIAAGAAADATPRDDPRLRARCRGTATVAGAAARFDC